MILKYFLHGFQIVLDNVESAYIEFSVILLIITLDSLWITTTNDQQMVDLWFADGC